MEGAKMSGRHIRIYRRLIPVAFLVLGAGCISASSEISEYAELDLDEYGRMDRKDFIETIRPLAEDLVFVRGRILITQLSYPEAPYVGDEDGEIYPCTNNPFDVPLDEYPTRERVKAGLVPAPWFFTSKFAADPNDSVASVNMDINYQSHSPVKDIALSEIHGKCVTLLVKLTLEMDIASIASAGTLHIHNVYDTEFNLKR